ncbi:hypothetical protein ACIP2Y_44950 [Streptomyces sviceus]|uniref:hypothetical protein n=1 Tax=Streptomyces sviceus TaxID=285530 RepID=UPI00381E2164
MAHAVELAAVLGSDRVDQALGFVAAAGRFAEDDLVSILERIAASKPVGQVARADEAHSGPERHHRLASPGAAADGGWGVDGRLTAVSRR